MTIKCSTQVLILAHRAYKTRLVHRTLCCVEPPVRVELTKLRYKGSDYPVAEALAQGVGVEPTFWASKARVLPLDDPCMESVKGVDPSYSGWKPDALPLSYTDMVRTTRIELATGTWQAPVIAPSPRPHGASDRIRTCMMRVATAQITVLSPTHGPNGRNRTLISRLTAARVSITLHWDWYRVRVLIPWPPG